MRIKFGPNYAGIYPADLHTVIPGVIKRVDQFKGSSGRSLYDVVYLPCTHKPVTGSVGFRRGD